jgi:beta-galactosidase/beta-glucuronidase
MQKPRNEYPRPQFVRKDWLCLNGLWQFEIDCADSGIERGCLNRNFTNNILVPYCPESKLSGIEHTAFMNAVWYRRKVKIPDNWNGKKTLLHFQAVDYEATVWVNGQLVANHRGCWSGFTCDLDGIAEAGEEAVIVVRARDLRSDKGKPGGKQCNSQHHNYNCFYTRTTGIWQTVWMEPVSRVHLQRPKITPDLSKNQFILNQPVTNSRPGTKLRVTLKDDAGVVVQKIKRADVDFTPVIHLPVPSDRLKYWSHNNPFLYDFEIELLDFNGKVLDSAQSYGGLRSITIDGKAVKLNGNRVFQRLVLDQGYYPDGIMTAPDDESLKKDIELGKQAGFNGARLHQKVSEERFLYYCDKMGYLVWSEFGDWGMDYENPQAGYITQWLEVLHRDYSHPSIVGWCGLNETRKELTEDYDDLTDLTQGMFLAAKAIDSTRPILDVSGFSHRLPQSDIYDSHCYEQNPVAFKRLHNGLADGTPYKDLQGEGSNLSVKYKGQPYFCSEFGGIKWCPETADLNCRKTAWGYGKPPTTAEEFYERFQALCSILLDNPDMFGYCYTQLTDTYQERNGIYFFDRKPKFDLSRLRKIQHRPAAIEKKQTHKSRAPIYLCQQHAASDMNEVYSKDK